MLFRKASFIFAASFAQAAFAQPVLPRAGTDTGAQQEVTSSDKQDDRAKRVLEPVNDSAGRVAMPAVAFGRLATPRPSSVSPTFNPDGPYFLTNVAGNRVHPGYEPFRRRVGSFIVSPAVSARLRTDDNWTARGQSLPLLTVISTAADGLSTEFGLDLPPEISAAGPGGVINPQLASVGDIAVELAPSIGIASDWSRNAVSIDASARLRRFVRLDRLDTDEIRVDGSARFDFGRDGRLTLRVAHFRQVEPTGTNGLAVLEYFGFGPSLFATTSAGADVGAKLGRLSLLLDGEFSQERYSVIALNVNDLFSQEYLALADVPEKLEFSQRYRDRSQFDLRLRMSYPLSADFDVYLVPTYSRIRPRQSATNADPLPGSANFASNTIGFLAGIRRDFNHTVVVQAGVRFQSRDHLSAALATVRRLDLDGAIDWYPTPRISLRINAAQQFRSNAIPGQADISTRTFGLRADYELLRSVGLRLDGSAAWDRFPSGAGALQQTSTGARQDASVQVFWNIGRSTDVNFVAGGHRRRANNSIFLGSFAASRFSLSLTRRF